MKWSKEVRRSRHVNIMYYVALCKCDEWRKGYALCRQLQTSSGWHVSHCIMIGPWQCIPELRESMMVTCPVPSSQRITSPLPFSVPRHFGRHLAIYATGKIQEILFSQQPTMCSIEKYTYCFSSGTDWLLGSVWWPAWRRVRCSLERLRPHRGWPWARGRHPLENSSKSVTKISLFLHRWSTIALLQSLQVDSY